MIYYLIEGSCTVYVDSVRHDLVAGTIYFISGYKMGICACSRMVVRWLELVPTDFSLERILRRANPFHEWTEQMLRHWQHVADSIDSECVVGLPLRDKIALDAFVGDILSTVIATEVPEEKDEQKILEQLQPAIDFMDKQYRDQPQLAQIAQSVDMAANAFHRLFKEYTGLTPYQYMLNKRMSDAQRLLMDTCEPVKAVAYHVGYHCPYHFSKVVKKYFGKSPMELRKQGMV